MKVLCVCSHLGPGGAQRQWSILLPALRAEGLDPHLGSLEAEGPLFEAVAAAGVPARCARMSRRSDVAGARRALGWARLAPDVVLSHGVRAQVLGELIARRAGVPHVTADHRAPGLPFKPHRELLLRAVAPRIDRVVAVTERQIPQLLRRRYRRTAIRVIPNGVDARLLVPMRNREQIRQELGLAQDDFVALLLSVLRPEKRAEAFVRAVDRAARACPRVRGIVAGSGPDQANVEQLARAAGGSVAVLGHRDDVADLILAADVLCLTSAAEAIPMSALEAMCLGRPVVATRVGAVDEVVVDGQTGVLVPFGDDAAFAAALVALATDRTRVERYGRAAAARQRALFRADAMVRAYAAVLTEVASAASHRACAGAPERCAICSRSQ